MTYLIIMNIFERVADNSNAHVDQVRGGHFKDLFRELLTVLVDLLHTKPDRYIFTSQLLQTVQNIIKKSTEPSCAGKIKLKTHLLMLQHRPLQSNGR